MARKRLSDVTEDVEKIDHAAGVAAARLADQLESCQEAIGQVLKAARDNDIEEHPELGLEMFATAGKLMLASSALASALARLKGEFHQHITVAHQAPPPANGNAPSTEKAPSAEAERRGYPRLAEGAKAGGGGEN